MYMKAPALHPHHPNEPTPQNAINQPHQHHPHEQYIHTKQHPPQSNHTIASIQFTKTAKKDHQNRQTDIKTPFATESKTFKTQCDTTSLGRVTHPHSVE
jgi:hypothetical protein